MDIKLEQVQSGALVKNGDGPLGRVARDESAGGSETNGLPVILDETGSRVLIPPDLVEGIDVDGSVRLCCSREELERLADEPAGEQRRTLELREERLAAHRELEEAGRVRFRKEVEEVPRRLEVDAYREEAIVEHVPIGRVVKERQGPREEDGVLVVPVYEEQLVVVKRLVLTEEVRIRREGTTERRLFEDTVRRERLVAEDLAGTGRVREQYATDRPEGEPVAGDGVRDRDQADEGGFLDKLGQKLLK
jgi:uncharacterized protein (TIGR02271 family)